MAAKRRENAGTDRCNITNVYTVVRNLYTQECIYIFFWILFLWSYLYKKSEGAKKNAGKVQDT